MKKEIHLLLIALQFYTRIPVSKHLPYSDDALNKATRYFPFVGYIIGAISFLILYGASFLLPVELAVLLSMLGGMLLTGAFHEDGLADFFDGFGGGWTQEKILDIMKDSRVGTYGMVATILQLALKFFALKFIVEACINQPLLLFTIFLCYHALARTTAIQVSFLLPYVREDEKSKAKPIAKKHRPIDAVLATILGCIPLLLISYNYPIMALCLLPLVVLIAYFRYFLNKWIKGYTGDCLGALEQISEVVILITFVALWKFI